MTFMNEIRQIPGPGIEKGLGFEKMSIDGGMEEMTGTHVVVNKIMKLMDSVVSRTRSGRQTHGV